MPYKTVAYSSAYTVPKSMTGISAMEPRPVKSPDWKLNTLYGGNSYLAYKYFPILDPNGSVYYFIVGVTMFLGFGILDGSGTHSFRNNLNFPPFRNISNSWMNL